MKIQVSKAAPVVSSVSSFDPELIQEYEDGLLVLMRIADFLKCARRIAGGPKSKMKAERVRNLFDEGTQFNALPYLRLGDTEEGIRVLGHEGRHRSMLLESKGYTHVPVLLRNIEEVPPYIIGEHGNKVRIRVRRLA